MTVTPLPPAAIHHRTPLLPTPFHARTAAHNRNDSWAPWAGYRTAAVYDDETMEYFAVRNQAGVYDISPMIKYRVTGRDAAAFMDRLQLRAMDTLKPGRVLYTAWCNGMGRIIDDGTVFRFGPNDFRICCQERMLPWLLDSAIGHDVSIRDETDAICGLSLQGPLSFDILRAAGAADVARLAPFDMGDFRIGDLPVMISRTGYTGDLGYELWLEPEHALALWDRLFEAGRLYGLRPFGNAALNLLRIEAGFIQANSEFVNAETALRTDRPLSPFELGLGWMVDFEKGPFNGRRALFEEKQRKTSRYRLVGLEIDGNIAADHALVYHAKRDEAGHVTAAAWSPTAKRNVAIALLKKPYGFTFRDDLWVEIYVMRELQWQKLMVRARIVERPFLRLARRIADPLAS